MSPDGDPGKSLFTQITGTYSLRLDVQGDIKRHAESNVYLDCLPHPSMPGRGTTWTGIRTEASGNKCCADHDGAGSEGAVRRLSAPAA